MDTQLMLIPETKEEQLEREVIALKKEIGNVRRGLFARHSELQKKYDQTIHEFDVLKMAIAKGDKKCRKKSRSLSSTLLRLPGETPKDLFTYTYAI